MWASRNLVKLRKTKSEASINFWFRSKIVYPPPYSGGVNLARVRHIKL